MKSDDMPMWDDPAESELVRDLLTAGRSADVSNACVPLLISRMPRLSSLASRCSTIASTTPSTPRSTRP